MLKGKVLIMNFRDFFRRWKLDSIRINTKFAEMEFVSTEDDQTAAWDMYDELITRITTQPLSQDEGDEAAALDSIYSIFDITREILKSKGRNAESFTKIAIVVLNQVIRPFTSKWHKKKLNGAFADSAECLIFRNELSNLQAELIQYTKSLADLAMVEDLTVILEEDDETQE